MLVQLTLSFSEQEYNIQINQSKIFGENMSSNIIFYLHRNMTYTKKFYTYLANLIYISVLETKEY
jgi:hypothetical protein